jgi:Flp pilus assembly pilin Flp
LENEEMMLTKRFRTLLKEDRGQGTLEYVLIIGIIVVVLFGILFLARKPLKQIMNGAVGALKSWFGSTNGTINTAE